MQQCFSCILRTGGGGLARQETAAWIVQDKDQKYCVYWGFTNEVDRIGWKGVVPKGVIGLVHRHPYHTSTFPSDGDRIVARYKKMPIYVAHLREGVWAYHPDQDQTEKGSKFGEENPEHGILKHASKDFWQYAEETYKDYKCPEGRSSSDELELTE